VGLIEETGRVTVAEVDGTTRQWQAISGRLRADTLLRLRIEAGRALVASGHRRLAIWDAATTELLASRTLRDDISEIAFAPCGAAVGILSAAGEPRLWRQGRRRLDTLASPDGATAMHLCLTAGGRIIVAADLFGCVWMERADDAVLLIEDAEGREIVPAQINEDRHLLLSIVGADRLLLSALANEEQNAGALAGLVFGNIREARLSPAGTHVLVTGDDGAVFMLAIEGGSTPVSLREKLQGKQPPR
jgi:hypothetical protein